MRLLHLSDLHIGKQVNEFPLLEDQARMLETIVGIIEEKHVDAVIIAGDVYDRSAPSADAVACFDRFLSSVADTGAACFIIPGNHDSAERIAYASELLEKNRVHIPPVYAGSIIRRTLADEHGDVVFWLFPFLRPAHVRPFFPDEDIPDYTAAMRCAINACDIDPTQRNVAIAHQFVTCGGKEPELSDSELSLGGIDNVDASVFDAFDYVALGHIHRPQRIGRDTIRYSGSLLKYSASEIRYPKSAPLVTLGAKGDVDIELIPLVPIRDMREIKGPLEELVSDETIAALSEGERNDYVCVVLTDEFTPIDALSALRAVYPNVLSISFDNTRTSTTNDAPRNVLEDADRLNPIELFERFYREQNGAGLTESQYETVRDALEESEDDR
ncbi:MAG: exonuclease SbcCD subunit D [Slackia sp.]|nr:exonuclease SbcCD subunit D [Slackia sp.]